VELRGERRTRKKGTEISPGGKTGKSEENRVAQSGEGHVTTKLGWVKFMPVDMNVMWKEFQKGPRIDEPRNSGNWANKKS